MKRSESSYLKATIEAARTSARRHDPVTAALDVAEVASIAMHTDKPRLRLKAMRALVEASTTRNAGSRFAALEALEGPRDAVAGVDGTSGLQVQV